MPIDTKIVELMNSIYGSNEVAAQADEAKIHCNSQMCSNGGGGRLNMISYEDIDLEI